MLLPLPLRGPSPPALIAQERRGAHRTERKTFIALKRKSRTAEFSAETRSHLQRKLVFLENLAPTDRHARPEGNSTLSSARSAYYVPPSLHRMSATLRSQSSQLFPRRYSSQSQARNPSSGISAKLARTSANALSKSRPFRMTLLIRSSLRVLVFLSPLPLLVGFSFSYSSNLFCCCKSSTETDQMDRRNLERDLQRR